MSQNSLTSVLTPKEVYRVLAGLVLALFVAIISVTIIGSALPTIVSTLHGSETHYTWIVTAILLSSTTATPIFGRLGDIYDKKVLLLICIGIFSVGSIAAGAVNSANWLIGTRVIQGIGMGGLQAMVMTVIAAVIPPRERGKYNGFIGAVMTVASVSGPLVGGFIVSSWGWRWCLWISVPFSLLAMIILGFSLKVPPSDSIGRKVDYWGATLITLGTCLLLIVLSLGGTIFCWTSPVTISLVAAGVISLILATIIELRIPDPVVPVKLLRNPMITLIVIASILMGLTLNAPAVFLTQYFQIGRGLSPAMAGLATLPLMIGSFLASTICGLLVTRSGRWKPYVIGGLIATTLGCAILGLMSHNTGMLLLSVGMFLLGAGQGAALQNMVLAVQNVVPLRDMGASTAMVTFVRSLGGAIGMQLGGLILSWSLSRSFVDTFFAAGVELPSQLADRHGSMNFSSMPESVVDLIRESYGNAFWAVFLAGAVVCLLATFLSSFAKASVLRNTVDLESVEVEDDRMVESS